MDNHGTGAGDAGIKKALLAIVARGEELTIETGLAAGDAFALLLAATQRLGGQLGLQLNWVQTGGESVSRGGIVLPGPGAARPPVQRPQ